MMRRSEMGERTPPPTERTVTISDIKVDEPEGCKNHKFSPVRLDDPTAERNYHVLYVACPNCGDFMWMLARPVYGVGTQ